MNSFEISDVIRGGSLVCAMRAGDAQTWYQTLAAQQDDDEASPYATLCAVTALAVALVTSVADLSGDEPDEVAARHVAGLAELVTEAED